MDKERTRVLVELQLDCGCWVARAMHTTNGPAAIEKTLHLVADSLPHWFDRVELSHKCEMVDDDNPSGLPRTN